MESGPCELPSVHSPSWSRGPHSKDVMDFFSDPDRGIQPSKASPNLLLRGKEDLPSDPLREPNRFRKTMLELIEEYNRLERRCAALESLFPSWQQHAAADNAGCNSGSPTHDNSSSSIITGNHNNSKESVSPVFRVASPRSTGLSPYGSEAANSSTIGWGRAPVSRVASNNNSNNNVIVNVNAINSTSTTNGPCHSILKVDSSQTDGQNSQSNIILGLEAGSSSLDDHPSDRFSVFEGRPVLAGGRSSLMVSAERSGNTRASSRVDASRARLRSVFRFADQDRGVHATLTMLQPGYSKKRAHAPEMEVAGIRFFALDPASATRVLMDILLLIICVHDTMFIPYDIAWDLPSSTHTRAANIISLVFWIFDIILNFLTGFVEDGIVIKDFRRIARRYIRGSLPFDLLLVSIDSLVFMADNVGEDRSDFRKTKILRVLKLNRLARATMIFQRIKLFRYYTSNFAILSLGTRIVIYILYMNHLLCCFWFWLADTFGDAARGELESTWLDTRTASNSLSYRNADRNFQYLTSLHWALTQMTPGSMAVTPQNSVERVFNIAVLVIGLLTSSLLISQLSAKMVRAQTLNHDRLMEMDMLRRFLSEQAIPRSLSARIQRQVHDRASIKTPLTFQEIPSLSQLPASLRHDLVCSVFAPWFLRHTVYFTWCLLDDSLILTLASRVAELEAFSPDNEIFGRLNEAKKVMCIQAGATHYEQKFTLVGDGTSSQRSREGPRVTHWNDTDETQDSNVHVLPGQFVSHIALWCHWAYVGSLAAQGGVEVVTLKVEPLIEVLRLRPEILTTGIAFATAFSLAAGAPENHQSVDLDIAPSRVLMAMDLHEREHFSEAMLHALESADRGWEVHHYGPQLVRPNLNQLNLLREELQLGKCVLSLGADGQLLRSVLVCVVNIRNAVGEMLVQIGQYKNNALKLSLMLPGSKLRDGETAETVLQRVVKSELPVLDGSLSLVGTYEEEQIQRSRQHGLRTSYLKTTFDMSLQQGDSKAEVSPHVTYAAQVSDLSNRMSRHSTTGSSGSYLQNIRPFENDLGNGQYALYTWVKPKLFEVWTAPAQEADFNIWLQEYHDTHKKATTTTTAPPPPPPPPEAPAVDQL